MALNWEMAEGETKEISWKQEHYHNSFAVRQAKSILKGHEKSRALQ